MAQQRRSSSPSRARGGQSEGGATSRKPMKKAGKYALTTVAVGAGVAAATLAGYAAVRALRKGSTSRKAKRSLGRAGQTAGEVMQETGRAISQSSRARSRSRARARSRLHTGESSRPTSGGSESAGGKK